MIIDVVHQRNVWSKDTFKFIGNLCRGFVGVGVDTMNKQHFHWARICVNRALLEPPLNLDLEIGDWSFEILIIPKHTCKC